MPSFIYNHKLYYNPIEFAMDKIGGTWRMPILLMLDKKTLRFSELRKELHHISDKMLTSELRRLEEEGFIFRKAYPVIPPKVEYSITKKGKTCIPVIEVIQNYGLFLMEKADIHIDSKTTL